MKKFILFLCFILSVFAIFEFNNSSYFAFANKEPLQIKTIIETNLYNEPNIKSTILKKLDIGIVLTVDTEFLDDMFYKISLYKIMEDASKTDYAYVLKAHTLDNKINSPEKNLDYNALVKNDNSILYTFDTNTDSYNQTNIILKKDTKVRILDGYDKNKEYTYISYQDENGEILSYYIKTINLKVNGINYSVIVAISTLITCAIIISIVFGIKGRKKKSK